MSLARLQRIVERLRAPDGCPWDRRQTHRSLKPNLLEETYEVLEAIDHDDAHALKEELGDLLLQVVFHASLEAQRKRFTLDDAIRHVSDKLVRRHPHVFGRGRKVDAEGALAQWEHLKRVERSTNGRRASGLDGVPRALPALARAARVQGKAAKHGFEWRRFADAMAKFDEETAELKRALRGPGRGRRARVRHELGDALFALAKVGRLLGLDPEGVLQEANDRFIRRFRNLERVVFREGREMRVVPVERLQVLWRSRAVRGA